MVTCARCLRYGPADTMIRSAHTKLHYCRDFYKCDRRMQRRQRELARREGVLRGARTRRAGAHADSPAASNDGIRSEMHVRAPLSAPPESPPLAGGAL